jgi:hypothetical protein
VRLASLHEWSLHGSKLFTLLLEWNCLWGKYRLFVSHLHEWHLSGIPTVQSILRSGCDVQHEPRLLVHRLWVKSHLQPAWLFPWL